MSNLAEKKCVPCQGGVPPFTEEQCRELLASLGGDWEVVETHHLYKRFTFSDFMAAMRWINSLAELAEAEGHHPDFAVHYNEVEVTLWTHKIDGLTESDFVMAAKIDKLAR